MQSIFDKVQVKFENTKPTNKVLHWLSPSSAAGLIYGEAALIVPDY